MFRVNIGGGEATMDLFIVKDGTVPIAIAKVIRRESGPKTRLQEAAEVLANSDAHSYLEHFEVPSTTTAVTISWADGWGFEVKGYPSFREALRAFNREVTDDHGHGVEILDALHRVATFGNENDESYLHVWSLS